MKSPWYIYIVRCNDDTLYTGITTSLTKRLTEHNSGTKGAKYTRSRRPVTLVYSETCSNRARAAQREWQIKHLPVKEKRRLATQLEIVRRPVKYARIRVTLDKPTRIVIPKNFAQHELLTLLSKKEPWIEKSLKKIAATRKQIPVTDKQILYLGEVYTFSHLPPLKRRVVVDHHHKTIQSGKNLLDQEIQRKWYRGEAKKLFTLKIESVAREHGFSFHKLYIRSQKTKWGTCSGKQNISLNYRLIKAPEWVIDYMVAHELVHTRIMNHSKSFKTALLALYPDYILAEKWLDEYGHNL